MATKRKNDEKKEFVKASRRYPRNFEYKNVVGVTLYKEKNRVDLKGSVTMEPSIILTHQEGGNIFNVDAQDYGYKESRVWITSVVKDPTLHERTNPLDGKTYSIGKQDKIHQTILNIDFDLVEISRKDFDGYHGLILTRREIFSDSPVDNGFLGEWFAINVSDLVPWPLHVEEINRLVNYIKVASEAGMDAVGAKEVLERGWVLQKRYPLKYPEQGWKQ